MKLQNHFIFGVAIILVLIMNHSGGFNAINERIYLNLLLANQKLEPSEELVIIGFDKKSLSQIGKWPPDREIFMRLLNVILPENPAVVGLTIAFTEKNNPDIDQKLYDVMQSFPATVIIPEYKTKKLEKTTLQVPVKTIFPLVNQGHTLIDASKSSIVFSFQPYKYYPAFSLEVLRLYYEYLKDNQKSIPRGLRHLNNAGRLSPDKTGYSINNSILIDYQRPLKQFKHLSLVDVINNRVKKDYFAGKIVLIGLTDQYIATLFATPFTGINGRPSSAVELQAQIIDSLINYRGLDKVHTIIVYITSLMLVMLFLAVIQRKKVVVQGLYFVIFLIIPALVTYILFKYFALWYPVVLPLVLIVVSAGLSIFLTTFSIDDEVIKTFNKIRESDKSLPVADIPPDIDNRVKTLTTLLNVIHADRETIKAIIDGVNNGIVVINHTGTIIWCNILMPGGYNKDIILNKHISSLLPDINFDEIQEIIKQEKIYKTEIQLEKQFFTCQITAISTDKAKYVAVFNDITDLKQLDRLKSDMVKMVSHELKTPLTAIKLNAEGTFYLDNDDKKVENIQNIIHTTDTLIDVVNNFLNLSRLEANMVSLNIKPCNISELIQQSISLQLPVAQKKEIEIVFNCSEIISFPCDKEYILIVLNNLISNALKYSPQGETVYINLNASDTELKTTIINKGPGIPAEDREKVFETFYRSRNNSGHHVEGSGLGLSIVRKIVKMHGGKVFINHEGDNGFSISFVLPLYNNKKD